MWEAHVTNTIWFDQASQIETSSILAPGYADTCWRMRAVWMQWLNKRYVYIYFAMLTNVTRAVWSACKLLGVTLDCKLSWSKHVDTTVVKIGRSLSIIKHCSSFLTGDWCLLFEFLLLSRNQDDRLMFGFAKGRGPFIRICLRSEGDLEFCCL